MGILVLMASEGSIPSKRAIISTTEVGEMSVIKSTISHSEVDTFLACERRHYYSFGQPNEDGTHGIEPVRLSDGLYRGNIGHFALEAYYDFLAPISEERVPTEAEWNEAKKLALATVTQTMLDLPIDEIYGHRMEMMISLQVILTHYFDYWLEQDKQYEFKAVEMKFRTVVDDFIDFPFTPDLIRRHRTTGRVEVVDHKFLANLYTPNEIAIQPQLAKYLGSLRKLGYQVDDGVYNLICHRVLKTKPYDPAVSLKRTALHLTKQRVEQSMKEQDSVVRTIAKYEDMSNKEWEQIVRRSANSYNCKHCPYLGLCISDLNGESTDVTLKYEYRPNSYGYNKIKLVTVDE